MPLYIPLVFLIFAAFYNFCTLQKIKVKIALFPAFVLLALMLMGQNYGIDINAYRQYYNEIEVANFWKHHVEMGYAALMALNKLLGFNFNVFLFVLNSLLFFSLVLVQNIASYILTLLLLIACFHLKLSK